MLKDFLEPAAGAAGGALPAALRDRLKKIPREVVLCRDRDRLYRAARPGAPPDPAAAEHLAGCGRCAELYGALRCAFEEKLPPPPPKLEAGLRALAGRPDKLLPVWIADSRYATAACILLAVLLTGFADDAGALLSDTSGKVGKRASAWVQRGSDQGAEMWSTLSGAIDRSYHRSQERLQDFGESCEELFRETARALGALVNHDPKTPDGGESDGNATSDPV